VEAIDRSLIARENSIKMLKFHLKKAQDRMKQQVDKHRTDRTLTLGDFVYVKLQPYRQQSVVHRSSNKLSAKFFGPFPIIAKIGAVAYILHFPAQEVCRA